MGGSKVKAVDMSIQPEETKKTKKTTDAQTGETKAAKKPVQTHERSKKYILKRGMVDRTKVYALGEAVELLQKTSYSSFTGTVSVDIVVKDEAAQAELTFPHSTGKTKRVVVVTDALLKEIEAGKLDFDVLVTEPSMMPKLAKFARILGPKGLMPNPKMGTVTTDTAKKVKELEAGRQVIKTEKKAPLMHVVVGKTDMKANQLVENIETLIKAVNARKIIKLVVSATMSPGIKVDLAPYIVV